MRPFDKFKEIDARLAVVEAALQLIQGQLVELRQAIDNTEPIVLATVAPPPAKRRGRPPKTA